MTVINEEARFADEDFNELVYATLWALEWTRVDNKRGEFFPDGNVPRNVFTRGPLYKWYIPKHRADYSEAVVPRLPSN